MKTISAAVAHRELAKLAVQRPNLEDADAHEHVDEGAGVDVHERLHGLAGHGLRHQRLARAWRSPAGSRGACTATGLSRLEVVEEDQGLLELRAPHPAPSRRRIGSRSRRAWSCRCRSRPRNQNSPMNWNGKKKKPNASCRMNGSATSGGSASTMPSHTGRCRRCGRGRSPRSPQEQHGHERRPARYRMCDSSSQASAQCRRGRTAARGTYPFGRSSMK